MVAIPAVASNEVDFEKFYSGVRDKLPSYARPIFIRLVSEIDITGKHNFTI